MLLSDGSGLTARQVATRLAAAGHTVGVLTPDPLALTRFTRTVHRTHRVPPYGTDPFGWLAEALAAYTAGGYDVLVPTQEQVAVLARAADRVGAAGVRTAVPGFDALVRVQDKLAAQATLADVGLPQPAAAVVGSAGELRGHRRLPAFVKTPIGTASRGVARVDTPADLARVASSWEVDGSFADGGVLVQDLVEGPLVMVQSVFAHGSLVASHVNLRVREGVSGGASHKRSLDLPPVREHLAALGGALGWHGALSLDAVLTDDGPRYIDVNPRLVEPGNAWESGVDLVGALCDLALGRTPDVQGPGRPGVATHQGLLAVLGAARQASPRRAVLAELVDLVGHRGDYRDSVEELTPVHHDWRSAVPVAVASAATLVAPSAWRWFSSNATANYALDPEGWRRIRGR